LTISDDSKFHHLIHVLSGWSEIIKAKVVQFFCQMGIIFISKTLSRAIRSQRLLLPEYIKQQDIYLPQAGV